VKVFGVWLEAESMSQQGIGASAFKADSMSWAPMRERQYKVLEHKSMDLDPVIPLQKKYRDRCGKNNVCRDISWFLSFVYFLVNWHSSAVVSLSPSAMVMSFCSAILLPNG
jgi:hypothetical protein